MFLKFTRYLSKEDRGRKTNYNIVLVCRIFYGIFYNLPFQRNFILEIYVDWQSYQNNWFSYHPRVPLSPSHLFHCVYPIKPSYTWKFPSLIFDPQCLFSISSIQSISIILTFFLYFSPFKIDPDFGECNDSFCPLPNSF